MSDSGYSSDSSMGAADGGGQSGIGDYVTVGDSGDTSAGQSDASRDDDPQLTEGELSPDDLPGPDDPQLGERHLSPDDLPGPPDPQLPPDSSTEEPGAGARGLADELSAVERASAAQDAGQVAAAYENGPAPLTREEYNAEAAAWADSFEGPSGVKEVEFSGAESESSDEPPDDRRLSLERNSAADIEELGPAEVSAISDAKARLESRSAAGDVFGGDPVDRCELWHEQGHNDRGYLNDCALASTAEVLQDCGVPASEHSVVELAATDGRCDTGWSDPRENGGSDLGSVQSLLGDHGVDADLEHPVSPDALADRVDSGRGVVTGVNSAELWDGLRPVDPRGFNPDSQGRVMADHAVMVTGTIRDVDGNLQGFVINDTGVSDGAGTVVGLDVWDRCWTNTSLDRATVVTVHPTEVERGGRL